METNSPGQSDMVVMDLNMQHCHHGGLPSPALQAAVSVTTTSLVCLRHAQHLGVLWWASQNIIIIIIIINFFFFLTVKSPPTRLIYCRPHIGLAKTLVNTRTLLMCPIPAM